MPDLVKLGKMVKTVKWIEDNKALTNVYIMSGKKTRTTDSPYYNKRMRTDHRSWNNQLTMHAEKGTTINIDGRQFHYCSKAGEQPARAHNKGKDCMNTIHKPKVTTEPPVDTSRLSPLIKTANYALLVKN